MMFTAVATGDNEVTAVVVQERDLQSTHQKDIQGRRHRRLTGG